MAPVAKVTPAASVPGPSVRAKFGALRNVLPVTLSVACTPVAAEAAPDDAISTLPDSNVATQIMAAYLVRPDRQARVIGDSFRWGDMDWLRLLSGVVSAAAWGVAEGRSSSPAGRGRTAF